MKINIEVDCTPQEARAFLGLPDVAPVQARVMEELERRLMEALSTTDPKTLLDQWLPMSMQGMQQWQTVWAEMLKQASGLAQEPDKGRGGGKGGGGKDKG